MDGLEVCRLLKGEARTRTIPVIMLTAKGEEADIVSGLELGADDYLPKPFSPRILRARINAPLLEQALVNLIDNAVKYSPAGSAVQVEALRDDAEVVVRVRDQGVGIEKSQLDRIFERFYRVDAGRSRKIGGTGLGLAIVKHIAQAHHGRVTVESTPGAGSLFSLHLPAE